MIVSDVGNTVVVVTHDLEIGKQAERRLTIRDGRFESARANAALPSS